MAMRFNRKRLNKVSAPSIMLLLIYVWAEYPSSKIIPLTISLIGTLFLVKFGDTMLGNLGGGIDLGLG